MCEQLDLTVTSLKRIAIGSITLGNLKSGTWKRLSRAQVDYLKNYK
jgi:23S rRNA pseudouridine2605 synthase